MRFRFNLQAILILITSLYIIMLGIQDDLDLYIHPRYIVLTLGMSFIALVLSAYELIDNQHAKTRVDWTWFPLIILVAGAILLPAKTLSSATFSQRKIDGITAQSAGEQTITNLFANSSKNLSLADWTRILNANQNPEYYASKQVNISGFIYNPNDSNDDFVLARFLVSCCAIDAQPIGVPVYKPGWQSDFNAEQWIEVQGRFEQKEGQIMLVPQSVTPVEQPENPYGN